MTKHKTYINITKIEKYKKLNMTEHKTDMNITKIDKYKKTEQHFFDGAQNRHEHYWKTKYNFYDGTQNYSPCKFRQNVS